MHSIYIRAGNGSGWMMKGYLWGFDDDDLPVGCRTVLDQYYEVALSYGRNTVMFYCISVIVDLDPYLP